MLYIVLAILILYGIICFVVHYLDFGWKLLTGTWLNEKLPIVKKMRSGLFHRFLIFMVLTILLYGGLRQFLDFIPDDWGRTDEAGKMHPYKLSITSILAVVIAGISMYGFYLADAHAEERRKT
ncbi:hypothetical protein ACFQ4C_10450 [Larkinella insperata]|uniref:DUF1206 domain-containing protein n=1 Tax=Larkinella insperata TaxID=332158 RepID=A0ABW3Q8K3_9BACT|nr:hypothetical protein [Larkinella insperata]